MTPTRRPARGPERRRHRLPHDHHHHHAPAGDGRLTLAIIVNVGLTVVQILGGIVSGSLALIADALHNLSDAAALVIAFAARKIARKPADAEMTFGYGRAEVIAALINLTTLILLALYLLYEAVMRAFDPQPVTGWLMIAVAGVALLVDLVTAALTWAMAKDSVNIRAAFLHNLADAAGSVAVIVAGVAVLVWDWWLVDPLVTLLIAGYILWMAVGEIGGVIRILMQASPPGLDTGAVIAALGHIDGVQEVHHAHLWQMEEHSAALEAHVVVDPGRWGEADAIKARAKALLHDRFGIGHSTLELECAAHACTGVRAVGHG